MFTLINCFKCCSNIVPIFVLDSALSGDLKCKIKSENTTFIRFNRIPHALLLKMFNFIHEVYCMFEMSESKQGFFSKYTKYLFSRWRCVIQEHNFVIHMISAAICELQLL
jgi:hypothetical protein